MSTETNRRCHIVGVAGTGMSALAQVLVAQEWTVSGSDRYHDRHEQLPVLEKLRKLGVELLPQDGTGVRDGDCIVVASSAIESDNPDVLAATEAGAVLVPRAEMLARLVRGRLCVAVAGTSGKTTVTGMIGWILERLGEDPGVVNGGALLDWVDDETIGNVRIGKGGPWVVEVDESDRSLLHFSPDWAVITNVSRDHFELAETEELFAEFTGRVSQGVVDGRQVSSLPVSDAGETDSGGRFCYRNIPFIVNLPGRHNIENAISAVALCDRIGCNLKSVADALASFRGIQRRLEMVGRTDCGVSVFDDYAHNPAKIGAAWRSLTPRCKRLLGVWRPHGFGPLAFMRHDLADVLAGLCREDDEFCVLPVYYVGGTTNRTVTSVMFVRDLRERGVPALFMRDYQTCIDYLSKLMKKGDAVLTMGARDPDLPTLARELAALGRREK